MSALAESAAPGRVRRRPTLRRRSWAVGGGVLWIVLFACLLAGVVAVNVAVLRLNLEFDRESRERTELRADIAQLRSEISSAAATTRVERLAQSELGLVEAASDGTTYIQLGR